MCGIAGILELTGQPADFAPAARRMAATLRHRGPDDLGVWSDPSAGVALGHTRLAVVDLTPSGAQPMHSACGRYTLVFNGEIYNHASLRRDLASLGHRFRGTSDTETLLAAIAEWGMEETLRRSNGMFAVALWDRRAGELHLARDRAGEKPLYFTQAGGVFLFASEPKALLAYPGFSPEVDRGALALYLRYGYVPAPHSIYRGVSKLPPASRLRVRRGSPLPPPAAWWSFSEAARRGVERPFAGSTAEALAALEELLLDSVRLRMEADVPLGAFLSGGIDSSTIVALMQSASRRPVRTFTIGFHEASHDEAAHARAVASHLGTGHTELSVTPAEAMGVIPHLPALYDEPFADSSQIPTFLVSSLARRHVTVCLSGDGGDELFGGYNRHYWADSLWRRAGWMPRSLRSLATRCILAVPVERWDAGFAAAAPLLPRRLRQRTPGEKLHKLARALDAGSPGALYLALVSQWRQPESLVLGPTPAPESHPSAAEGLGGFAQRMMYLDGVTYLPDDILVKLDRASMGVSLEARAPFLDHRVIEFAWSLPQNMKIHGGQGKWILRRLLHRYVPRDLVERPKMGFAVPIGAWLQGPLREWAEDLLSERRLRQDAFLDPAPVRDAWRAHLAGRASLEHALWTVLMFQQWRQQTSQIAREVVCATA